MSTKIAAFLAAVGLLAAAACSAEGDEESAPRTLEGPAVVTATPDPATPQARGETDPGDEAAADEAGDDDSRAAGRTSRAGSRVGQRSQPRAAPPGGPRRTAARHPRAGSYVYDQNGYERYCRGATCSREELPPTQRVELSVVSRGDGSVSLSSDARISSSRSSKTTTRYGNRRALITRATVRFAHEQARYSNTYRPRPPIEALRFPLRVGRSWSGSWRDNVSGTYRVQVAARERVKLRGAAVPAFRLETFTRFSGEFEGSADVVVWVDPRTRAVLASRGEMKVSSFFGTFETEFRMRLRSGPGYR